MSHLQGQDASAATWFVNLDCENEDGISWATGFRSIQAAVGVASDGDSIWVKADYYTTLSQPRILIEKELSLMGGFDGTEGYEGLSIRDWWKNQTKLRYNLTYPCIASRSTLTIVRFFITEDGNPNGAAGLQCEGSTTVRNCVFYRNQGCDFGGAINSM